MKKIRVLLVEDNRLLREGLTSMLREQLDFKVVASLGNGYAADKAKTFKPHVVVLDLGPRSVNSLKVIEQLKKSDDKLKIIGIDLLPVQAELVEYVRAGVSGFVLKDATLDKLLRTIRSVAEGNDVLPPPLTGSLFSQIIEHATRASKGNPFRSVKMTNREREVMGLIAEGLSNKEIASHLDLAVDTVKTHVHNILVKLALHTRLEIASYSYADEAFESTFRKGSPAE